MRDRLKLRACDAHLCDKLPAQREANGRPRDGCPPIPKGKRNRNMRVLDRSAVMSQASPKLVSRVIELEQNEAGMVEQVQDLCRQWSHLKLITRSERRGPRPIFSARVKISFAKDDS